MGKLGKPGRGPAAQRSKERERERERERRESGVVGVDGSLQLGVYFRIPTPLAAPTLGQLFTLCKGVDPHAFFVSLPSHPAEFCVPDGLDLYTI